MKKIVWNLRSTFCPKMDPKAVVNHACCKSNLPDRSCCQVIFYLSIFLTGRGGVARVRVIHSRGTHSRLGLRAKILPRATSRKAAGEGSQTTGGRARAADEARLQGAREETASAARNPRAGRSAPRKCRIAAAGLRKPRGRQAREGRRAKKSQRRP